MTQEKSNRFDVAKRCVISGNPGEEFAWLGVEGNKAIVKRINHHDRDDQEPEFLVPQSKVTEINRFDVAKRCVISGNPGEEFAWLGVEGNKAIVKRINHHDRDDQEPEFLVPQSKVTEINKAIVKRINFHDCDNQEPEFLVPESEVTEVNRFDVAKRCVISGNPGEEFAWLGVEGNKAIVKRINHHDRDDQELEFLVPQSKVTEINKAIQ